LTRPSTSAWACRPHPHPHPHPLQLALTLPDAQARGATCASPPHTPSLQASASLHRGRAILGQGCEATRLQTVARKAKPLQMLEREAQLRQLASAWDRVMGGAGLCVQVSGEAGAGKSTLLRHFVGLLAAEIPRLWASCEPLLDPRPLSPFVDLAEHWPPSLAQALRDGRSHPGLLGDLRSALVRRCGAQLLVVEDVHWADAATLEALRYIGRRLADSRLLMVLSFRDDDGIACQPLRQVMGELPAGDVLRIAVPNLSAQAVATLAQQAGRSAAGLFEATGGNAFFVTESLSSASDVPAASVCDAVAARLARLTPQARAVAELVAVSPAPLERDLVEPLLDPLGAALDECCDKGVLRSCAGHVVFRHELARQAVLHSIAPGRATRLHQRLFGAARQRSGVALQRLVHHAAHAGLDAEVLALAPRAARAAAALSAHHEAAALYRRALAHSATLEAHAHADLLEAAAAEYRLIGAVPESMAASEQALALRRAQGDAVRIGMNLRLLAMAHCYDLGQRGPAQAAIDESISSLRSMGEAGRAELALACAAHSRMLCGWSCHDASIEVGDEAVRIAEALPHTTQAQVTLVQALRAAASARLFVRDDAAAYAALERALALALQIGAEDIVAQLYALQQTVSLIYRRHARALAVAEQGLAWCAARDLDAQRARLLDNRALSLIELGRWKEADETLAECLLMPACNGRLRHSVHYLQARLRSRRGDAGDGSVAAYWQSLSHAPQAIPLGYRLSAVLTACAEAAWLQGEDTQARCLAQQSAQAALQAGDARLLGPALVWLARLGAALPRHSLPIAAEHAFELAGEVAKAAAVWREQGCLYEAALTAMRGDESHARWALQTLLALGADAAAEVARSRLRTMGFKGLPRGPQPRTRHDPEGLTPRQRQIHALLAQGLSNAGIAARLHRSERTVENHVSQVLAKLGVPSRVQLAQRQALF
jgi:DNA-binding CsgD family transcriptional regulator/energy-coupling factor transporter ATP-binding protein EcfA2